MPIQIHLPTATENRIAQFAAQQHLSVEEAVLRLIETGLQEASPSTTVFEQGLGLFASPEDSTLLDEAVASAYAGRRGKSSLPQ